MNQVRPKNFVLGIIIYKKSSAEILSMHTIDKIKKYYFRLQGVAAEEYSQVTSLK
jgi:hypothetical protein